MAVFRRMLEVILEQEIVLVVLIEGLMEVVTLLTLFIKYASFLDM